MAKKAILIVDDEKNILLTLQRALTAPDTAVDTCMNGLDAIAMSGRKNYDLVLLDIRLPEMDGIEVLHKLREVTPNTDVIMITAHGTVDHAVDALKSGAVDFIQKPFTPEQIRTVVDKVMARRHMQEDKEDEQQAHMAVADKLMKEHQYLKAITEVEEAITLVPTSSEAYNLLGVLLEVVGDMAKAIDAYQRANILDPGNKAAQRNLERMRQLDKFGDIIIRAPHEK